MVTFTPDVNLGNILTLAGVVALVLGFLHKFDKKIDMRHQSNLDANKITTMTMRRIEQKVDDNTKKTETTAEEIAKHMVEDRVTHSDFRRRFDELRQDIRDNNNNSNHKS